METAVQATPTRRRFDVDEYHAMIRAGILMEGDRVELIDGEILEMHSIGGPHFACVVRLTRLLVNALGDRASVSVQNPVRLDRYSEPEPDVAVLRRRSDDYATGLPEPSDTFLAIEVADTSLAYDRQVKLPLYARTGVPEVWIVDLNTEAIEAHTQPSDRGYEQRERITAGSLSPGAFFDISLELADILPPTASEQHDIREPHHD